MGAELEGALALGVGVLSEQHLHPGAVALADGLDDGVVVAVGEIEQPEHAGLVVVVEHDDAGGHEGHSVQSLDQGTQAGEKLARKKIFSRDR